MSENLNPLEISILKGLETRQGKENKISRASLVEAVNFDRTPSFPMSEREIRKIIKHLTTQHGFAIGSKGGKNGGYYMCQTSEEIEEVCKLYDGYGLTSLFTSARLRKIEMRDYLGQLSLKFQTSDARPQTPDSKNLSLSLKSIV